jgi:hypothetical protein
MRRLVLLLLLAFALPAAPAAAGGWATVQLATMPGCLSAGTPWHVELYVKQHGMTPLDDARPTIRISDGAGDVRTFAARHTGRPGTYAATVTFPRAGTWRARLFDGWTDATPHRLSPLQVAAKGAAADCDRDEPAVAWLPSAAVAPPPPDEGLPWPQIAAIGFVSLLWAAAWIGLGARLRLPRRSAGARRYLPAR